MSPQQLCLHKTILWQPFPLPLGLSMRLTRAKAGSRETPLMLFSLGQHAALRAVQRQLQTGELVFAYMDDIHVITTPDRVLAVYNLLPTELRRHARIRVRVGKTQVWNKSGVRPGGFDTIDRVARLSSQLCGEPTECQGIRVLVCPLGHDEFVHAHLESTHPKQGRCSSASPESPTSNQRGHCSCTVPVQGRTVHCEW